MATFRRQAAECVPYCEYLELLGVDASQIARAEDIPALPIELFKTHDIYCGDTEPEAVFTSSATTGMTSSRHPMRSLALYEEAFRNSFRTFTANRTAGASMRCCPTTCGAKDRRWSTWPTD